MARDPRMRQVRMNGKSDSTHLSLLIVPRFADLKLIFTSARFCSKLPSTCRTGRPRAAICTTYFHSRAGSTSMATGATWRYVCPRLSVQVRCGGISLLCTHRGVPFSLPCLVVRLSNVQSRRTAHRRVQVAGCHGLCSGLITQKFLCANNC